jgi:hypothetical protein
MSSNPFATRFIRPGALAYLFPPGESAQSLVDGLRANQWRGQIIGPHGSGKSTLLAALVPALQAWGRTVIHCRLSNVESPMSSLDTGARTFDLRPSTFDISAIPLKATSQLIIDGFEQLSWLLQRRVKNVCAKQQTGLLITTHRDLGLPTIYRTEPTLELARAVVARLLPTENASITADDIAAAYRSTNGNIRETLFALFDIYHQRNSRSENEPRIS